MSIKKKTKNKFVTSIEHIKELNKKGHYEFALILHGGGLFSRKNIKYSEKTKKFSIINHIDNSKQYLTEKEILNEEKTNIGKAIPLNSLIAIID